QVAQSTLTSVNVNQGVLRDDFNLRAFDVANKRRVRIVRNPYNNTISEVFEIAEDPSSSTTFPQDTRLRPEDIAASDEDSGVTTVQQVPPGFPTSESCSSMEST
ncbi:unnamed protein product, partial [Amoebophrya sp. A25]